MYSQSKHTKSCPSKHFDTEAQHCLRDHVIVLDAVKIKFNLSTDKTCSFVNNASRALVKKY